MVLVLWDRQVNAIIDVKIGGTDADSYKYEPMTALLARWETINKDKHGNHCHDQRKHFCRFFYQWMESLVLLSKLSRLISEKRE